MKKSTRAISGLLVAINLFSSTCIYTGLNAHALDKEVYSTIIPPIPQSELERMLNQSPEEAMPSNLQVQDSQSLPASVDLSTSPYFPPIGSQGGVGSCVAWSTTYYQFTFAANKLNNIVSTESTAYSPSWVYNWLINAAPSATTGVERTMVYDMISKRGCLTMADCPYYNANGTYNSSITNDTQKMIDALKTRISSYNGYNIRTSDESITSPNDSKLNEIKTLLNNGYLLQVNIRYNFTTKQTTNNEEAVCAYYNTNEGHGLTVVGYNDNIKCDINNDGVISTGEMGALKIADSHGTDEHDNGFFWVMYDALNYRSDYSDNNNRVSAFSYGGIYKAVNTFYYIEVENQPVNVVALLDINTNCINDLNFTTTISLTNPYYDSNTQDYISFRGSLPDNDDDDESTGALRSYNGKLPLDYGTLDEPASVLTNSSTCFLGVYMSKRRSDSYTDPTISCLTLCDDKMNTLNSTTSIPAIDNGTWFKSIYPRLKIGDLNYNYIIDSSDADILLRYLVKKQELSTLQLHIADVNKDGAISLVDLNTLNKMLPTKEKSAFISSSQEIYNSMSSKEKIQYNNLFSEIGCKTIAEYDTIKN